MKTGPALENLIGAVAESCRSGLDQEALRAAVLPRLRRAVPVDALWWATVDPATSLFTQAYREEIPEDAAPYFVENEFLADDVNKWTVLARDTVGVRTLLEVTAGRPFHSARYRDIFQPLGLEDELRAVLRTREVTWGYLCLHREAGSSFSAQETAFIRRLAPHLAEGIRLGLLMGSPALTDLPDAPGLIVLAADGSTVSLNAPAEQWMDELQVSAASTDLPIEVYAVAAMLRRMGYDETGVPRLRVLTRAGRWATLCATWLAAGNTGAVAVIVEPASASEVAPLVMRAYGLTEHERGVTELVCQGLPTRAIALELHITANTVQDHLKSIFDKTGVRSRRELTATILTQQYLPRARAGQALGRDGSFMRESPLSGAARR